MSNTVKLTFTIAALIALYGAALWLAERKGLETWKESPRAIFGRMQRDNLIAEEGEPEAAAIDTEAEANGSD